MRWNAKYRMVCALLIASALLLAACGAKDEPSSALDPETPSSQQTGQAEQQQAPPQPVTIKFAARIAHLSDEEVARYVIEPVKKKHPHITVERVDYDQKGSSFNELVVSGQLPDIHVQYLGNLTAYVDADLAYNIEDLIKKHKFDLNRVAPEFIESLRSFLMRDHLIGLPIDNNAFGLFYNKNLFDKFGVAYPQDGLTWEDARNIAVRLNRNDGGEQYYGMHPGGLFYGARQLALPWIDVQTDRPMYQTEGWQQLFQLWERLHKLPGGDVPTDGNYFTKHFYEGKVGMVAGYSIFIRDMIKAEGLNWDVATYPTNPLNPGTASSVDSLIANVTSTSKHKDEAFQVLAVLLSDEVQTELSRYGRMSSLKDRAIHDQYGKNNPALEGKNVVALTKLKLAPLQPYKFNFVQAPHSTITGVFNAMLKDGKDINTALREADEQMAKLIEAEKQKLK